MVRGRQRRAGYPRGTTTRDEDGARYFFLFPSSSFLFSSSSSSLFLPQSTADRWPKSTVDGRFWRYHLVVGGSRTSNLPDWYVPLVLGGTDRNYNPWLIVTSPKMAP
ncbi:hypothetical protein GW17_00060752 [Ensete ventricosum]|nr:hypothetical protein GW17_00060752 [Ensete ventricosum]